MLQTVVLPDAVPPATPNHQYEETCKLELQEIERQIREE